MLAYPTPSRRIGFRYQKLCYSLAADLDGNLTIGSWQGILGVGLYLLALPGEVAA